MLKRALSLLLIVAAVIAVRVMVFHSGSADAAKLLRWIGVIAIVAFLGYSLLNLFYTTTYMNKARRLAPLLHEGEYTRYIEEMEALHGKAKGALVRGALALNLSSGYIEAGRYEEARRVLEDIPEKSLKDNNLRVLYGMNLADTYFRTGRPAEAREVIARHEALFDAYRDNEAYGAYIARIRALQAMDDGDEAKAQEILEAARQTWQDPRQQKAIVELLDRLSAGENVRGDVNPQVEAAERHPNSDSEPPTAS